MVGDANGREIRDLILLAQRGDDRAAETLLQLYRPLVQSIVRGFYLPGGDPEDTFQVGMIGLWQAVLRYDPQRQASFATFARLCIRRQLLTALKHSMRWSRFSFVMPPEEQDTESWLERVVDPAPSALDEQIAVEQLASFDEGFRRTLSSLEEQVLELYVQRLSYRQIAQRLGCSSKAVDNALMRIKRKARRRYESQG